MRARARWTLLLSLALAACGGGAEPEPAPEPVSTGSEEPPAPPPPPPPPARLRALHVTPEPAAATISIALDDAEPAIRDLAYPASSAYVEVTPGAHALHVLGVPSVETGEAPTLLTTEAELASDTSATALLFGLAAGEPALALVVAPDRSEPPGEGLAALRFFHALLGVGAVDVCAAGASPRDPALPVFTAAQPSAFASADAGEWAEVLPSGELALQLRAPAAEPCRGRVLGVARFTPSAGSRHTLVAIGRTTGRPRANRELFVCSDPPAEPTCSAVPIAAR